MILYIKSLLAFLIISGLLGLLASRGLESQCAYSDPKVSATTHPDEKHTCSPDPWEGRTLDVLRKHFDCDHLGQRPIHDRSFWMMMRGLYAGIVGPERSTVLQPLSTEDGFAVAYEVRHTADKGRGLFAKQNIKKGELVYTSTKQWSHFPSANDYRRFLQALPRELACDVMMWTYAEDIKDKGLTICLDLDEGALFNDGGTDANVGCDKEKSPLDFFALRDIREGEELLCAYDDFLLKDGLRAFGL